MSATAETIEWFIKLDLEIDIKTMQQFFREEVKKIVKFKPEFELVVKFIFDSKKAQKRTKFFINKNDSRPKGVHIEVIGEQALVVTSAIRKVIKLPVFIARYNATVYFSLQFEFGLNSRMQTEIKQAILKYHQLVVNVGIFEAQGIMWIDGSVSSEIKESLRELILKIESVKFPGQKLFISVERNKNYTYSVLCKKKFHKEASTVADHVPAYFFKLYGEGILSIFTLYYQDLAHDTK